MKLSLCIPTNGIIEWVFPALDSIYESNVDQNLFEVIVTDNGTNKEFKARMYDYARQHSNITPRRCPPPLQVAGSLWSKQAAGISPASLKR